ncbi:hypothetical protein DFJ73DRAFT_854468 [Zopfochytrium polystomum]|nr:hypothetical protein DFJ73DRAFT_854468 [Zopfochytrium polystomum]
MPSTAEVLAPLQPSSSPSPFPPRAPVQAHPLPSFELGPVHPSGSVTPRFPLNNNNNNNNNTLITLRSDPRLQLPRSQPAYLEPYLGTTAAITRSLASSSQFSKRKRKRPRVETGLLQSIPISFPSSSSLDLHFLPPSREAIRESLPVIGLGGSSSSEASAVQNCTAAAISNVGNRPGTTFSRPLSHPFFGSGHNFYPPLPDKPSSDVRCMNSAAAAATSTQSSDRLFAAGPSRTSSLSKSGHDRHRGNNYSWYSEAKPEEARKESSNRYGRNRKSLSFPPPSKPSILSGAQNAIRPNRTPESSRPSKGGPVTIVIVERPSPQPPRSVLPPSSAPKAETVTAGTVTSSRDLAVGPNRRHSRHPFKSKPKPLRQQRQPKRLDEPFHQQQNSISELGLRPTRRPVARPQRSILPSLESTDVQSALSSDMARIAAPPVLLGEGAKPPKKSKSRRLGSRKRPASFYRAFRLSTKAKKEAAMAETGGALDLGRDGYLALMAQHGEPLEAQSVVTREDLLAQEDDLYLSASGSSSSTSSDSESSEGEQEAADMDLEVDEALASLDFGDCPASATTNESRSDLEVEEEDGYHGSGEEENSDNDDDKSEADEEHEEFADFYSGLAPGAQWRTITTPVEQRTASIRSWLSPSVQAVVASGYDLTPDEAESGGGLGQFVELVSSPLVFAAGAASSPGVAAN